MPDRLPAETDISKKLGYGSTWGETHFWLFSANLGYLGASAIGFFYDSSNDFL